MGEIAALAVELLWCRWLRGIVNRRYNILCRFEPSCSTYSAACFRKYGIFTGGHRTWDRIRRCNSRNTDSCIDPP